MKLSEYKNYRRRAEFLEKTLTLSLENIKKGSADDESAVYCENRIGSITLPVGVAGPLILHGENISGAIYCPLATTEGALIASVSRGMKATTERGVFTTVQNNGVTRGPVLKAKTVGGAKVIERWIADHRDELAVITKETSSHCKLINIFTKKVGLTVFIRFSFDTDLAMGMNMATIASQQLIEYISTHTNSSVITVAGNFDIDKKPAWLTSILGRGYSVQAEALISNATVKSILKTSPKKIYEIWKTKCLIGSALSGSIGFNAHHANIVAAFYAATGQDLAHIVEGSLGMTIVDIKDDDTLYISVSLPSILIGTVGGGTKLVTQTESRSIIPSNSPYALAEVLSGAVLSGELSLLASLSEGSLAIAHKKLGR